MREDGFAKVVMDRIWKELKVKFSGSAKQAWALAAD